MPKRSATDHHLPPHRESSMINLRKMLLHLLLVVACLGPNFVLAQAERSPLPADDPFRQLEELLPTPNPYRTGLGSSRSRLLAAAGGLRHSTSSWTTSSSRSSAASGSRTRIGHRTPWPTCGYSWMPTSFVPIPTRCCPPRPHRMERRLVPTDASLVGTQTFDGGVNITAVKDCTGTTAQAHDREDDDARGVA